jgi:hypothetical protein
MSIITGRTSKMIERKGGGEIVSVTVSSLLLFYYISTFIISGESHIGVKTEETKE